MMARYILGKPIREYNAQEFAAFVRSLRQDPATAPMSKAADGIKLHLKDGLLTRIACKREKQITTAEIHGLAIEYGLIEEELLVEFQKRKFIVLNSMGEPLHATKPTRPKRTSKTQRDAHIDANTEGSSRADKLFIS